MDPNTKVFGILEPTGFSLQSKEKLSRYGEVVEFGGVGLTEFLRVVDFLFIRLGYRIDEKLLRCATKLKVVCSPTTGTTHLDLDYLYRRNIELISLKGESEFLTDIVATPEHTLGLVLCLLRNYKKSLANGYHSQELRLNFMGQDLREQTVGIIGFGRVGQRFASYLEAFSASIRYFDKAPVKSLFEIKSAVNDHSLDDLLQHSSVVVVCASYENGDPVVLGENELLRAKGKFLVNTSRGQNIDEDALINLIKKDWFSGVALDVICDWPKWIHSSKWSSLIDRDDFILTPHIAGVTQTALQSTETFVVDKLIDRVM